MFEGFDNDSKSFERFGWGETFKDNNNINIGKEKLSLRKIILEKLIVEDIKLFLMKNSTRLIVIKFWKSWKLIKISINKKTS